MVRIDSLSALSPVRPPFLRAVATEPSATVEQRVATLESRVEARLNEEIESLRARLSGVLSASPQVEGVTRGRLDILA